MSGRMIAAGLRSLAGLLTGAIAGVLFGWLVPSAPGPGLTVVVGASLGVVFGLFFGPHVRTAGTGLIWGQAYGLLGWLFGTLTLVPLLSGRDLSWTVAEAQKTLPILLGQVVGYGAVLGLGYYVLFRGAERIGWIDRDASPDQPEGGSVEQTIVPRPTQAVIVGGLGGLVGSWFFARGIETAEFFPLVAGLMGSEAMALGRLLHYTIGTIIGISFGLLFFRDVRSIGPSLVWGLDYGLVWWVVGPMTLLPMLLGMQARPDWSLHAAQEKVPSLVAHMLYGAIVGLFYALVNQGWRVLFVDSDPVNRALEGPGSLGLRVAAMGLGSGVVGGLLFTVVMAVTGTLPQVASLVGAQSTMAGLLVHLVVSIIVGMSYGLLFRQEALGYGAGLTWGTVYGLWWWLLGGATLFPILLRQPVDWSLQTVAGLYPFLVGHLLYGAGLGLVFQFLSRRYGDGSRLRLSLDSRADRLTDRSRRDSGNRSLDRPAPALWMVTLVLGVVLPLLLSMIG